MNVMNSTKYCSTSRTQ